MSFEMSVEISTNRPNIEVGMQSGGGTNNYEELENKPQIGGVTLSGNKTLDELGVMSSDANVIKQYSTMPDESTVASGTIVQYIGSTTSQFTNGFFYKRMSAIGWVPIIVGNDTSKVDKVPGKILSTNDFTNEYKSKLDGLDAALENKANVLKEKVITSHNQFDIANAIHDKILNTDGVVADYNTGLLSDFIPVKGRYVVASRNVGTPGTGTQFRVAGYDADKNYLMGYKANAPAVAYTTATGETRYRTAITTDFSSCVYIRVSTVTDNLTTEYMVGFTNSPITVYNADYDEYVDYEDKNLESDIKVPYVDARLEVAENTLKNFLRKPMTTMQKFVFHDGLYIKLLGDSITEGYGGTGFERATVVGQEANLHGVCWANMLREYMTTKFNCTFKNLGSTSMHTQTMHNNIFHTNHLLDGNEDVIILMIGTNDRKFNTEETFYSNLKEIIARILSQGTEVILMSSLPSTLTEENITTNAYHMCDVDNIIMKVATEFNLEYISLYKKMYEYLDYTGESLSTYLNSDGLHPNDNGYALLYKFILSGLGFGRVTE